MRPPPAVAVLAAVAALALTACDTGEPGGTRATDGTDGTDGTAETGRGSTTSYVVPGASMEPTIAQGSRVAAEPVEGYRPVRGDVVVIDVPDWLGPGATGLLVKRVVGLPGETVTCCDADGLLTVDGEPLVEDYVADRDVCRGPMVNGCTADWGADVADGTLFVMGDNRAASVDSSDRLCQETSPDCDDARAFVPLADVVAVVRLD